MKAPIFFDIHMCPTVKASECVERRAKLAVKLKKFVYPQKTHVLLIKKIIGGTISNEVWFRKKEFFFLENDHWIKTSVMVYHTLACALCEGSR